MDQRTYWDQFYTNTKIENPSDFAIWISNQSQLLGKHLVDWGCGSGRDGLYLAKFMDQITLVDNSEMAIQSVNERILYEHIGNAKGFVKDIQAQDSLLENLSNCVIHYARFFLHAIDDQGLANFIRLISSFEKSDNVAWASFEYRIMDPQDDLEYVYGNHQRWLRSPEYVATIMKEAGWQLETEFIGREFAVFHEERPLVARQIFFS